MGQPLYSCQNPSFHCFLVQIRGIVFQTSPGLITLKESKNEMNCGSCSQKSKS